MGTTKVVAVTQYIKVTLDEDKFDAAFHRRFNESIFDTGDDIREHFKHLAQLNARGIVEDTDFIEGYGLAKDMGIKLVALDHALEVEIDDEFTKLANGEG